MHKYLLPLFIFFIVISVQSQELKKLNLENTVFREFRDFYPERLSGVEWISENEFVNYAPNGNLLVRNIKGDTVQTITPNEINAHLSALDVDSIMYVRPYMWLSPAHFIIKSGLYLLWVNKDEMVCEIHLKIPQDAVNLEFSPASGHLAYTVGNNVFIATQTDSAIRVTNHPKDSDIRAGIAIHQYEFGIEKGLFWSEDGQSLGFYEMDESMVTDYPLVNYNPVPAEANLFKYSMAGQKSHHAKTGIYDVRNKKLVYLKTGEPLDHYLTNFAFSPNGKYAFLAEVNRAQKEMHLNKYDAETGDLIKKLFTEIDDKYVEPQVPVYFPRSDSEDFLWQSRRDGYNHIYSYNKEGKLLRQITKGNFEILSIDGKTENGNTIVVTASDGLLDRAVYAVNVKSGRMKKLTSQNGMHSVMMGEGKYFIMRHSSPEVAGRMTVNDISGKVVSTLIDPSNPLDGYEIGEVEFPVLKADDGTQLQARLIKPFDFDSSKKYPVLVYVYGGPHLQLITRDFKYGAPMWMYEAANRGYIIFSLDNRGSANRGKEFEQAVFRNLGTVEMEDQLKGVEYLKSLPYVDGDRMGIHGWSYGGFMTTSFMLRHPGVFKVGVAGGSVTDWRMYEIMYTERYMDSPQENEEGYKTADLKNYADKLEGKLLMIHGLDDNVVVPQHSFTLLKSFVDAGKQVDFFVYPGHEHNVRGKDRVHLMTKVLDYVDGVLKE